MTVLEQKSNPNLASLALGLFYGLTFCASACLTYITSHIAGMVAEIKKEVIVAPIDNSGCAFAYAVRITPAGLLNKTTIFRTGVSKIVGAVLVAERHRVSFNTLSVVT